MADKDQFTRAHQLNFVKRTLKTYTFDKDLEVYLIFLSVMYTLNVLHLGFNIQMLNL